MTAETRKDRYRISEWGSGYFRVDEDGELRVHPTHDADVSARLADIMGAFRERDLHDPIVLRFPQILSDRQRALFDAFASAIEEYDYPRHFQGVFPVKVNHDRTVVETLAASGFEHRFGLEVGSKAELCLALTVTLHPEAYIVCNGFKDKDYLELACHAARHGRSILVIAENPQEIHDIIEVLGRVGDGARIGFRARLHTEGSGRWQESSGHKGKFGLSTMEIIEGMEEIEAAGKIDALHALHFHIGSQVCDILNLKSAIKEATRLFCEMKRRAPRLDVIDMGGGLGVDYDGSRSATDWSMNYTLEEYARDAVYIVKDCCSRADVEPPVLVTESGRALTAYHAVVVLSSLRVVGKHEARDYSRFTSKAHQIEDLKVTLAEIGETDFREAYHDATQLKNELLTGFKLGYVTLEDRAVGESLYRDICFRVRELMRPEMHRTRDMVDLQKQLAPKFVCNFSVFMTAPDTWAVSHLFPVCPISKLDSTAVFPATIGDITCDSDGKLERFVGRGYAEEFLWLQDSDDGAPYYIGMFLVGAYQDVLGDFHNLFGTVNEGVVAVNERDDFTILSLEEASSVEHSLDQFGFQPIDMLRTFDRLVDRTRARDEVQAFKGVFLRVLHGSTYLQGL